MNDELEQLIQAIDDVLPQTQCELCEHPGCKPYATAIATGEAPIDLCLPGGVETLHKIAKITKKDPKPLIADLTKRTKAPTRVIINEQTCIGCTKCLAVCPTDAIIGAGKLMHTVIADACTGCELCIPPCPVDCIEIIPITEQDKPQNAANNWRQRHNQRLERLKTTAEDAETTYQQQWKDGPRDKSILERQQAIAQAIARSKQKQQPQANNHESN